MFCGGPAAQTPSDPATADGWAARGRELLGTGSTQEALAAFQAAVRLQPDRMDLHLEYAGMLKNAGYWLRSAERYKTVLAARPDDADALIEYSELLLADYQFADAEANYLRILGREHPPRIRDRALFGLGSARFGREDFAGAAETYTELIGHAPASPTPIAFLAITRRKMGQLDEALRLWEQYLKLVPDAVRAKVHRTDIIEQVRGIEQARASVQSEPSNPHAWGRLGDLLRTNHDPAGAVEAYSAAARLSKAPARFSFMQGLALRQMKRWREAAAAFALVVPDARFGALALYNLAWCARQGGDRKAEAAAWSEAIRLNPADMYAFRRHVESLGAAKGLELEEARLERLAEKSDSPLRLVRLAIVRAALKDADGSRRAALEALRLDPNEVQAQRVVRDLLALDQQATQSVLETLNPALSTAPAAPQAQLLRGAVLLIVNRPREAIADLRAASAAAPDDARAMVALANALRAEGRSAEALELIRTARQKQPGYLYAHLDLALSLMRAGRLGEAVPEAREAISMAADNPLGYSILGAALRAQGDLSLAADALERAVSLDPMDDLGAPRLMLARTHGAMGDNQTARDILRGYLPEIPLEIYRMSWEFTRDTYQDRTFHGQDWRIWEHRFDGKLSTTADALSAVALMLASLDDRNSRLRSADQTASLMFSTRTEAIEFSATGTAQSTSRTVQAQRLQDNVGYIAITNLDDPKVAGEVRKAVEEMKTADGVILDLRGNQGGSDSEVPALAGLFVKPGTETGTLITPGGTEKTRAEAPGPVVQSALPPDKPVVVLVDRNTASSAESLAGSLRESRRAVLVGEKTYGKGGVQMPRLLPGGSMVLVVGAEHADLQGNIYTGAGLQPDVSIQGVTTGSDTETDPAVRKARDLLRKPQSP